MIFFKIEKESGRPTERGKIKTASSRFAKE